MNYGNLTNYTTGFTIRPATAAELTRSLEAAFSTNDGTGVFRLDGLSVFVADEDNEAHRACGGAGLAE